MADEEGELPMFIEDEEEGEAAAEREKRREKAAMWGPDKIREKYLERMREYAEARSSSASSPARRVDPEEESPEPPMRYLSLGRGGPQLASSANILSIKVVRSASALAYPIDVYGTVFVRDELDRKRICLFRRDRDNCQRIKSKVIKKKSSLLLIPKLLLLGFCITFHASCQILIISQLKFINLTNYILLLQAGRPYMCNLLVYATNMCQTANAKIKCLVMLTDFRGLLHILFDSGYYSA